MSSNNFLNCNVVKFLSLLVWKTRKDMGERRRGQENRMQTTTHNPVFVLTAHRRKGCCSVKAELCRETSLKEFLSMIISPGA